MNTVLATLINQHDLRLVLLAAGLCLISSLAGLTLLHRARRTAGRHRVGWLAVAAVSVGFGIWTTHFIGMLAFSMGMATGYDVPRTLLSLLAAIGVTGLGFWWATIGTRRSDTLLGGAIVGAGIALMHYLGMSALLIGGSIVWDESLVSSSLLLGIFFGSLALWTGTQRPTLPWRLAGGGILTIAICAMHFTGMGALGLQNCFPIVSQNEVSPVGLSIFIAAISLLILLLAFGGIYLDMRDRRRRVLEQARLHALVDAAIEGLVISDGRRLVTANQSFLSLTGTDIAELETKSIIDYIGEDAIAQLVGRPNVAHETLLSTADGRQLPVEMIWRDIDYNGRVHQVTAVRDLSERKLAEQHIKFLADHDVLTGLANRASFNRRLQHEMTEGARKNGRFAVLCLDIDRFKEVNDQFGHVGGDALLQKVGTTLRGLLGHTGFAARLGGDEFSVIIPDIQTPDRAGRVAEEVLAAFAKAKLGTSEAAVLSTSIGIAIYPDDGETVSELMSSADAALYQAKRDGRGVFRYFETEMGLEVRQRRQLEVDLRLAIPRNQLRVVYQPQSEVKGGRVVGFEALVRWDHPERGAVPPGVFIPIAEEAGLIAQIGDWVLRVACAEAVQWENELTVAVNVSAVQLEDDRLPELVAEILETTGLPAARLELEITETALMRDMGRALSNLNRIKLFGVRIAMDDFGTGFSSLANLRAFPFDKIKIDRSFITSVDSNEQSAAIVRAIVALGAALKLEVIAEGIERPEELEFLRRENCAQVQGYLMGRPADISQYASITRAPARAGAKPTRDNLRLVSLRAKRGDAA